MSENVTKPPVFEEGAAGVIRAWYPLLLLSMLVAIFAACASTVSRRTHLLRAFPADTSGRVYTVAELGERGGQAPHMTGCSPDVVPSEEPPRDLGEGWIEYRLVVTESGLVDRESVVITGFSSPDHQKYYEMGVRLLIPTCTYEPAILDGLRVRALVEMHIGLGP